MLQCTKLSPQRYRCHNYHLVLKDLLWHTFLGSDKSPLDLMCLVFPRYCYQYIHPERALQSQYHMPLSHPTHTKKFLGKNTFEDLFRA